ncbi:MAG: tRNA (5-methylaminomethyl-2-thiouridine)(34)-methyltransferase MnmD [Cyclobacteriaceae bacterium]|nr:tRNA (5-methylaminomethyl-2-thiouridine)(34)-methyltransferase MnmD [Cyclobacteriaceae bacterium]
MSGINIIVTEDGSHSLFNSDLNETYHSIHGAIQESKHVFIRAGLEHWLDKNKTANLRILEIGFGTGLNALLTILYSKAQAIHYNSWEAYPLDSSLTNQLNYGQELGSPELFSLIHSAFWEKSVAISSQFILGKHKGDILTEEINPSEKFDIIYYDAFGPSKQPDMWTLPVLTKIINVLDKKGIFVTYCAKGQVKRDLKSLGLEVETLPGPPGKLQMIRATRN